MSQEPLAFEELELKIEPENVEIKAEPEPYLDEDQLKEKGSPDADENLEDLNLDAPDYVRVENSKTVEGSHFKCTVCSKVFAEQFLLDFHSEIHKHIWQKNYVCHLCGKVLKTFHRFQKHIEYHLNHYAKCPFCPEDFFSPKKYSIHLAIHKRTEKLYPCSFCDKKFHTRKEQNIHERVHTNVRPYQCSICKKSFKQAGTLKVHINNVHDERKDYQCVKCLGYFSTSSSLKRHEKQIHGKGKSIPCKICGVKFYNQDSFHHHQIDQHLEKRYFKVCPICGEPYFSRIQYQNHLKTHPAWEERIKRTVLIQQDSEVPKKSCINNQTSVDEANIDSNFAQDEVADTEDEDDIPLNNIKKSLIRDKTISKVGLNLNETVTDNVKQEELQLASGIKEEFEETLSENMELNKKELDYDFESNNVDIFDMSSDSNCAIKCSLCEETFATKEVHDIHYHMHVEKKWQKIEVDELKVELSVEPDTLQVSPPPVACSVCGIEFKSQNILDFHKTIHKINKDLLFSCQFCVKKYSNRAHYTNHVEKHILDCIECQQCPKTFFTKRAYKCHMKVHTLNKRERTTCRICREVFARLSSRNSHEFAVHGVKGNSNYTCHRCSKQFNKWHYFNLHMKYLYTCNLCDVKLCKVEDIIRKHMISKHQSVYKTLDCVKCGKYFENQREYRLHYLEEHPQSFSQDIFEDSRGKINDDSTMECSEQDKSLQEEQDSPGLNVLHTENGSGGVSLIKTGTDLTQESEGKGNSETGIGYKCDQCGKRFGMIIYFRKHLRNHSLFNEMAAE